MTPYGVNWFCLITVPCVSPVPHWQASMRSWGVLDLVQLLLCNNYISVSSTFFSSKIQNTKPYRYIKKMCIFVYLPFVGRVSYKTWHERSKENPNATTGITNMILRRASKQSMAVEFIDKILVAIAKQTPSLKIPWGNASVPSNGHSSFSIPIFIKVRVEYTSVQGIQYRIPTLEISWCLDRHSRQKAKEQGTISHSHWQKWKVIFIIKQ